MQVTAEASFLSLVAVSFVFVMMRVGPNSVLLVLVDLDKNRAEKCYKEALPNGGWKLLQGPSDIYMVRSISIQPRESHFSCVTACPQAFSLRYFASYGWYPRCKGGQIR
jgi:hypothetical protein